jgi:hypothetical protein
LEERIPVVVVMMCMMIIPLFVAKKSFNQDLLEDLLNVVVMNHMIAGILSVVTLSYVNFYRLLIQVQTHDAIFYQLHIQKKKLN